MGKSSLVLHFCRAHPTISRPLLRGYLASRLPVPERAQWVVDSLADSIERDGVRTVRIGDRIRMRVDMSTYLGRRIYYYGTYEPSVMQYLEENLQPGDTFIDAGANVGELTLRGARRVGASGRVIAVEASAGTAKILRDNVQLNLLTNVRVVEAALTAEDKTCEFFLGRDTNSLSSSLTPPDDFAGQRIEVPGISIATLLADNGNCCPKIIKMDVEGAEYEALRPVIKDLAKKRPKPRIIFEYNQSVSHRAGWTACMMQDLLRDAGYKMMYLNGERAGQEFSAADEVSFSPQTKLDFVAE